MRTVQRGRKERGGGNGEIEEKREGRERKERGGRNGEGEEKREGRERKERGEKGVERGWMNPHIGACIPTG